MDSEKVNKFDFYKYSGAILAKEFPFGDELNSVPRQSVIARFYENCKNNPTVRD